MKLIFFLILICCLNTCFGHGLVFSTISEKPDYLRLIIHTPYGGERAVYHIQDNDFYARIRVEFDQDVEHSGDYILNTLELDSNSVFNCDGTYDLNNDIQGQLYIQVMKLTVCLDEKGVLRLKHNGMSDKEVQKAVKTLVSKMQK